MKLTIAVLALLCLSSAVSASSHAANLKLPLAHLFAGQALGALGEANITVADLVPSVNMSDIMATFHHMPKFQFPINMTGMGGVSLGNVSDVLVPLVPIMGLKAAKKALPLLPLLAMLNSTAAADVNFTMPSLPSVNISQMAVPLGALLALPKAHKALPLVPLLAALNLTSGLQMPINISMPQLPTINISDVGVPLGALLHPKFKGLPLLALMANASASLPVVSTNVTSLPLLGAVPFKALLGLKHLPLLGLKGLPLLGLMGGASNMTDLAMSALAGLSMNKTVSAVPLGGLASLSKAVNISDLPLGAMLALGHKGLLAGMAGMMANITSGNITGPSVDVSLHKGSFGMKNLAFNLSQPTFGIKPVALALNITHPELALKLAALNLSVPMPDLRMGSRNVSVSVPLVGLNLGDNSSADGNSTGFLKSIAFSKPGLLGGGNISLPLLKPELALKLAQLGFQVPTPELGLKRATFGAALPVPDVQLSQRAVNLTLGVPDLGFKQVGVNLTVPDIQLPRLEFNVSGMPKLGLDALKSATLLAWLKDAGFYAIQNATDANGTTVINLAHGHPKVQLQAESAQVQAVQTDAEDDRRRA